MFCILHFHKKEMDIPGLLTANTLQMSDRFMAILKELVSMNKNKTAMLIICVLCLLPSCGKTYPDADGVYLYHSGQCDTLKQDVLKGKQIQYMTNFQIKNLSGLTFHEIDSVIIISPEKDSDSVSVFKLKHEKGEFIFGAGHMSKWKPELWIYDHDIPVQAENIPDGNNIWRILFKERLSKGVHAICIKKPESGFPEIQYYDFKIE